MFKKLISLFLSFTLIFTQPLFAQGVAQLNLGSYLSTVGQSIATDRFRPLHMRYFSYDLKADNFQLLLDKGDNKDIKETELEEKTKVLMEYFQIGLALPNDKFWVNLRPDAQDEMIDPELEKTDMGKIMLEADLQLKRDTAQATSPQTPEGKAYWDKLYKKAGELFGTENITIPTITRPWIVPGEIILRQGEDSAYIFKANMKVMLEHDYLNSRGGSRTAPTSQQYNFSDPRMKELNEYSSQLIRELIIPKLTKEVNSSKRYASLRQVFFSLVMARWFKDTFSGKPGQYAKLIDSHNLNSLTSKQAWDKTYYFNEYKKSFEQGEYNLKENITTPTGQVIRSYVSGGIVYKFTNSLYKAFTILPIAMLGLVGGGFQSSDASMIHQVIVKEERVVTKLTDSQLNLIDRIQEEKDPKRLGNIFFANIDTLVEMVLKRDLSQEEYKKIANMLSMIKEDKELFNNKYFVESIRDCIRKIQEGFLTYNPKGMYHQTVKDRINSISNKINESSNVSSLPFTFTEVRRIMDRLKEMMELDLEKEPVKSELDGILEQIKYWTLKNYNDERNIADIEFLWHKIKNEILKGAVHGHHYLLTNDSFRRIIKELTNQMKGEAGSTDVKKIYIEPILEAIERSYKFKPKGSPENIAPGAGGNDKKSSSSMVSQESKTFDEWVQELSEEYGLVVWEYYVGKIKGKLTKAEAVVEFGKISVISGDGSSLNIPLSLQVEYTLYEKRGLIFYDEKSNTYVVNDNFNNQQVEIAPTSFGTTYSGIPESAKKNVIEKVRKIAAPHLKITDAKNFAMLYEILKHNQIKGSNDIVYEYNNLQGRIESSKKGMPINVVPRDKGLRTIVEYLLLTDKEASSSMESAINNKTPPEKAGGIDFRQMNYLVQPMGSFKDLQFGLPTLTSSALERLDLDKEFASLRNMVKAGMVPSGERVKEYLAACFQKGKIEEKQDDLLVCLAEIYRLAEEENLETSPELRESLVIVDTGKFVLLPNNQRVGLN